MAGRNRQCKHCFEHRRDIAVKCYIGHPYPILIQRRLEYGTTMCRSAIQRTVPIMQTLFRARNCHRQGKYSPPTTWSMKLQGSLYAYLRNKGFQLTKNSSRFGVLTQDQRFSVRWCLFTFVKLPPSCALSWN